MTQKTATPVVSNKFWIVEEAGEKIANIQAIEGGGYTYVKDGRRERFPSLKDIEVRYNISMGKKFAGNDSKSKIPTLYGFPVQGKTYNESYNVQTRIPVYSKTASSKSMYCAGYYCVELDTDAWISHFCPKLITIKRYPYLGPFKSENELLEEWKIACPHLQN